MWCEFAEPLAVVLDLGLLGVKDFEHLFEIRFRVGLDLLAGKRRARFGLAGGIADHGGKVPDKENGGVAHFLEVLQLADHHGVAQVNVRRRGIDAQLHAQGLAGLERLFQLRAQLRFGHDLRHALFQVRELFFHWSEIGLCHLDLPL